jgi:hypothetical protein
MCFVEVIDTAGQGLLHLFVSETLPQSSFKQRITQIFVINGSGVYSAILFGRQVLISFEVKVKDLSLFIRSHLGRHLTG